MKPTTLIKSSGATLLLLGVIHLLAHFLGPKSEEVPEVIQLMNEFTIEMMGTYTLMQFHQGFSLMTGVFMISLGMIHVTQVDKINRSFLKTLISINLLALLISAIYFHPLAYGMIALSTIMQIIAFSKYKS